METKTKQQLTTSQKQGCAGFIVLLIIFVAIYTCVGGDDSEPNNEVDRAQLQQDSISLIEYLNQNVNLKEGMTLSITEFNDRTCRLRFVVPNELGKTAADVAGIGVCTLAAKWLSEKKYTVGHEGIYTTCYVYSPYVGVTQKKGMVISWGNARYDANTDSVKWEWAKSK